MPLLKGFLSASIHTMQYNKTVRHPQDFKCEPNPEFGELQVPVLLWCEVSKDNPTPKVVNIGNLDDYPLNPFTATLHYGQSIFEGLKAYKLSNNTGIFRLSDAAKRFKNSAKIMSMVEFPEEVFESCLQEYVKECAKYIPDYELHSLYLRPVLFASDQKIKVASSQKYIFMVMSSIVGDYFATKTGKTKVLVSKHFTRAFEGGTGEAKTAANYALSLSAVNHAQTLGYQQVLYLDNKTKTYFEELGGMNFFWVQNGEIFTPKLNGQILHGITRKTLIEIAKLQGYKVHEIDLSLDTLIQGHKDGSITEVFAVGTAATLVPLDVIGLMHPDNSIEDLEFSAGKIGKELKDYLLATHRGETELSSKFLTKV